MQLGRDRAGGGPEGLTGGGEEPQACSSQACRQAGAPAGSSPNLHLPQYCPRGWAQMGLGLRAPPTDPHPSASAGGDGGHGRPGPGP